ncbi:MAG: flagellar hook-length control protein FliK [Lachnospiraceae bacterium]|nr:flagellar hook-length control protein FliK [Lachnospiraceae bacterium]
MTSTSVLGSLNSQTVNLMNLTQPTSKNMGADFKDIMNQTGSKGPKLEVKSPSDAKNLKNLKNDSKPADEKPVVEKEVTKSDGTETKVSPMKDEREVTEAEVDAVKEAVSSVMESLKEELDVADEEILQALENLGLTQLALLDVTKLPEIVAEITGSEDKLSLMTDENLFKNLMTVEDRVARTVEHLLSEDKIAPEEFAEAIELIGRKEIPAEKPVMPQNPAVETEDADKPVTLEDKISIRIDRNVTKAVNTETTGLNQTAEETEFKPITADLRRSGFFDRSKEQGPKDGPVNFVQNLLNKAVEAMNEASETVSYSNFDVRNVLDQITEAIKVDVSPETSEINLRLHPESLGTVSVKVSANNEGVLTAKFTAQNESVKAIIESQAIVLKETLEAKGVTVEAVEVMVQSHEFERNLSDQSKGGENTSDDRKKSKGIRRIDLTEDVAETETPEDTLVREMMAQNGNTIDYTA